MTPNSISSGERSSRRAFFVNLALGVAALVLMPVTRLFAADAPPADVSESEPLATSLGFKRDATKVDTTKFPKRAGPGGKDQFCHTCMFYTKVSAKKGKCQIFGGRFVPSKGWCNTWAKKPA